jgi:hypothetical protein
MKLLAPIKDEFDAVNKGYVEGMCNTKYDAENNKVATMADIEQALYIDEEELV